MTSTPIITVGSHQLRIARKRTVRTPVEGYPTCAAIALVDLLDEQEDNEYPGVIMVTYRDGSLMVQRDIQARHRSLPYDLREVDWPPGVVVCEDGLPRYLPGLGGI